jgi:hypothetical protein
MSSKIKIQSNDKSITFTTTSNKITIKPLQQHEITVSDTGKKIAIKHIQLESNTVREIKPKNIEVKSLKTSITI